ncbi:MAG: hypothetical protein Q7S58_07300 [Candidatus Binatus sp.]|uniref:hypothetical protein n=1 Tax=Candidatus Binatus sp. TaxID=2811406 RepID=UPI00271ED471|nr:hypothetical protein [Candidatus Binatus sp.]MDO8432201.1 hypothetical protein [Candidatus Binatus sp.]
MRWVLVHALWLSVAFTPSSALAIRPFVTDDARVVGARRAQLETWLEGDSDSVQHWSLIAFGPLEPLELTFGGPYGVNYKRRSRAAAAGPIVQAKYLLRQADVNRWPGVAVAAGVVPPVGTGGFQSRDWDPFAYLAVRESFLGDDRVLIHVNLGVVSPKEDSSRLTQLFWGVGTQVRLLGALNGIVEIFRGDPYSDEDAIGVQFGYRYILNDSVQFDGTMGGGIGQGRSVPFGGSAGIRLVSPELW